ncbi:MAG: DUF6350 family protein [Actinomycetota bacterium]
MSLLDRHRTRTAFVTRKPSNALAGGPLRWRSAMAGGSAALVSMLTIALPAVLAWVASSQSTVEWTQALSVGSSAWLLANGAHLSSGPAAISLMPWFLTAIPLVIATVAARRIAIQLDDGRPLRFKGWGGLRRDVADAALAFTSAYAAVGLAISLFTARQPLHASVLGSFLGTAVLGLVSVVLALAFEFRGDLGSLAPDLTAALEVRRSIVLRRAIRPGLWGAFAIFVAGLALALAQIVMHLDQIGRLYDTLGADPVGVGVLSLGQATFLPNVALWAASWMAGPGFGFGDGSAITWFSSNPGLLPLIPGLGALPDPGPLPPHMWLIVLVPVAAGALVGWRALRSVARLSAFRVKAQTAASACVVAALVLTLASELAGGSLGTGRLGWVGAPSLEFGAAVLGELLVGAAVVVCLSHLRAARR